MVPEQHRVPSCTHPPGSPAVTRAALAEASVLGPHAPSHGSVLQRGARQGQRARTARAAACRRGRRARRCPARPRTGWACRGRRAAAPCRRSGTAPSAGRVPPCATSAAPAARGAGAQTLVVRLCTFSGFPGHHTTLFLPPHTLCLPCQPGRDPVRQDSPHRSGHSKRLDSSPARAWLCASDPACDRRKCACSAGRGEQAGSHARLQHGHAQARDLEVDDGERDGQQAAGDADERCRGHRRHVVGQLRLHLCLHSQVPAGWPPPCPLLLQSPKSGPPFCFLEVQSAVAGERGTVLTLHRLKW